jgi:hypothetical protein
VLDTCSFIDEFICSSREKAKGDAMGSLVLRPKLVSFLYKCASGCCYLHRSECSTSQQDHIPSGTVQNVTKVLNRHIDLSI